MSRVNLVVKTGQMFGRLTVIDPEVRSNGVRSALCRCACGSIATVQLKRLINGSTQSCGCIRREKTSKRNRATARHRGATKHPLFGIWTGMINRCCNPNATNYHWYGERGIRVCDAWRHDPNVFIEYIERELGPRPSGMTLDRISNEGNYEPGNVRWATAAQQANNRRNRVAALRTYG